MYYNRKQNELGTQRMVGNSEILDLAMFNFLIVTFSVICQFSGISHYAFTALIIAMVLDFVTGITKSYALGIPIESKRITIGVLTKVSTMGLILALGFTFKHVIGLDMDNINYTMWLITLVTFSEFYSVLSNMQITMKKEPLPEWDLLAKLGTLIRNILEKILAFLDENTRPRK